MKHRYALNSVCLLVMLCVTMLTAGCNKEAEEALGTLEWDRVNGRAPASEVITAILVTEGTRVTKGETLLTFDDRKIAAQYSEAEANLEQARWRLSELKSGPRPQKIAEVRARLEGATAVSDNDRELYLRQKQLYESTFSSKEQLDNAYSRYLNSRERVNEISQNLDELLEGTRSEVIEQARSQVAAIEAQLVRLQRVREEYTIQATQDGLVDSIAYKLGDRPPAHAVVTTILAGNYPWARVYVPEPFRASLKPGESYQLKIDGIEELFAARLRTISSQASFTPYYALTESDRSRLSYVTELDILDERAAELTAGTPVQLVLEKQ